MHKALLAVSLVLAASAAAQIPIGPQTGTFSGSTRGFYFQTPVPIVITGVRVVDSTNLGTQSVEVYKLPGMPPAYPATGSGSVLFYQANKPSADVLPCVCVFQANDYVGVLGCCGPVAFNSYGAGAYASNVLGQPITLLRFLTQTNLSTSGGNQLYSSEGTGSITRIEVYVAGHNAAIDYGAGTAATGGGIPSLTTTARPIIGTTATLSLNQNYSNAIGAIALAIGRANIPLLGGTILVNPPSYVTFNLPGVLPIGASPLNIPIPNNPALGGSPPIDFQGFVIAPGGLAMTNGTEWWLGL
jgi:hypothetical protein